MAHEGEPSIRTVTTPTTPVPRRVFTAPELRPVPAQASDASVETLFRHPAVKIVAFTAGPRSLPISPGRGAVTPEIEPGSLDPFSQLERTIAVGKLPRCARPICSKSLTICAGPFRIYRAPGSVAFLSCSSALQPILPKSQCWAVDELSSKYILQIRRPQYWRIELLTSDGGDAQSSIYRLRDVFDQILQFEKTPCPFRRTFSVVLPERPATPVKKRPWTPVRKRSPTLPPTPMTPVEMHGRRPSLPARAIVDSLHRLPPEQRPRTQKTEPERPDLKRRDSLRLASEMLPDSRAVADKAADSHFPEGEASDDETLLPKTISHSPPIPPRLAKVPGSRSVTVPPHLTLNISPPSKASQSQVYQPLLLADGIHTPVPSLEHGKPELPYTSPRSSPTDSSDSFHTIESWHSPITPLSPSPPLSDQASPERHPYPHESIQYPKPSSHHRDKSDNTITVDMKISSGPLQRLDVEDVVCSSATSMSVSTGPPTPDFESAPEDRPSDVEEIDAAASTGVEVAKHATVVSRQTYRHRATTSSISVRHNAPSALPPAVNLITPNRHGQSRPQLPPRPRTDPSRLALVRRLPMAVIHKTCEILLSPPGHLLHLMLHVAARIAAGEWRGFVAGKGEKGEEMAVSWDYSSDEGGSRRSSRDWGLYSADEPGPFERQATRDKRNAQGSSRSAATETMDPQHARTEANRISEEDAEWSRSWGVD
jgi:hypothetical protein